MLSAQRRKGPEALAPSDIEAWSRLMSKMIRTEESEMIFHMDQVFMKAMSDEIADYQSRQEAGKK